MATDKAAGPVPHGTSPRHEGAMTAGHAADFTSTDFSTDFTGTDTVGAAPPWGGGPPPWLEESTEVSWAGLLAAQFAQHQSLDTAAPGAGLAAVAGQASGALRIPAPRPAGPADGARPASAGQRSAGWYREYPGVHDDALTGLVAARRRLENRQFWEMLAALAELIRRRPGPGCPAPGPGLMPYGWDEGLGKEIAMELGVSTDEADELLALAWALRVKLPQTSRRLRDGLLNRAKAAMVARCCLPLTPAEAMAAEEILYGHPDTATMSPGWFRKLVLRAVAEVNPDALRERREDAARHDASISVRVLESGNMAISGWELPPAAVLAIDQQLSARARELRAAGVKGSVRELRVLAFLERHGITSPLPAPAPAPAAPAPAGGDASGNESPAGGHDQDGHGDDGTGQPPGVITPIAGAIHLTVPAATLTGEADRPGEMSGAGPVDPWQARDLARAAASSDRTVWECTITGQDGRPVAHACGKPAPAAPPTPAARGGGPGPPDASFTRIAEGPDPRYGTWLYTHGRARIIFTFENLAGQCDHRHQAAGHDPGKHLKHLTGILNTHCTSPGCRIPGRQSDYEHSVPFDQGGKTCLCEAGPVCRHDHRLKQKPGWALREAGAMGWFQWTTPSGRTYLHRPTQYVT